MSTKPEITPESLVEDADRLYAYALKRVGKHHTAEDLVQECLLVAWRKRESFDGRSTLSTWLFGILKFKILDHYRLTKRTPTDQSAENSTNADGDQFDPLEALFTSGGSWSIDPNYGMDFLADPPDKIAEDHEAMQWVRRCMERLPESLRLLFQLREVEELPVAEVASAAGVTKGSAAVMLTRARHQVRACLQQHQIRP